MRLPVFERFPDRSWHSVLAGSGKERRASRDECLVGLSTCRPAGIDESFNSATTPLDPSEAPTAELAALHRECLETETAYDEVKTHPFGPGALLRSTAPGLVQLEFHVLLLAHYALRRLIHEAAGEVGEGPDRLSFPHAANVVQRRIIHPRAFPPKRVRTPEHDILEDRAVSSRAAPSAR